MEFGDWWLIEVFFVKNPSMSILFKKTDGEIKAFHWISKNQSLKEIVENISKIINGLCFF